MAQANAFPVHVLGAKAQPRFVQVASSGVLLHGSGSPSQTGLALPAFVTEPLGVGASDVGEPPSGLVERRPRSSSVAQPLTRATEAKNERNAKVETIVEVHRKGLVGLRAVPSREEKHFTSGDRTATGFPSTKAGAAQAGTSW